MPSRLNTNTPATGALIHPRDTYTRKVRALRPIAYWPLAESSGVTVVDESGNGYNGTYHNVAGTLTGVTLGATGTGDGRTGVTIDGLTGYANIYSAGLNSAFNSTELTIAAWVKVSGAGVWTDATNRFLLRYFADGNNAARLIKTNVNNQLQWLYTAGGTNSVVTDASQSSTGWVHVAMTVSKSSNQMKAYLNGAQSGATQMVAGVWAGALAGALIGAQDITPTLPWSGGLAHAAIWNVALSAGQVGALANATGDRP